MDSPWATIGVCWQCDPVSRTTLDTLGHLYPDADESTRSAIGAVIAERMDSLGTTADELA